MEKTKAKLPYTLENSDGSVTVHLKEPIVRGDNCLEELTFKKPKAKHLMGLNMSDMKVDDILRLASNLSAEPPSTVGELGMADFMKVSQVINVFLDDLATDGKTP